MQNEKNEDNLHLGTSQPESQLRNTQATTEDSSPSPEETSQLNINRTRMIFLALLESAMRYREGFWREDIESYKAAAWASIQAYQGKKDKGWEKRAAKKVAYMVVAYKSEQEKFNRLVYKELEKVIPSLPQKSQLGFDNFATGFGILAEELLKAKNTTELLTVAKLYNAGFLDETFEQLKQKKENENTEQQPTPNIPPTTNITDDSDPIVRDVQKERVVFSEDATNFPTGQHTEHRHEQVGQMEDDSEQRPERTGHESNPDAPVQDVSL